MTVVSSQYPGEFASEPIDCSHAGALCSHDYEYPGILSDSSLVCDKSVARTIEESDSHFSKVCDLQEGLSCGHDIISPTDFLNRFEGFTTSINDLYSKVYHFQNKFIEVVNDFSLDDSNKLKRAMQINNELKGFLDFVEDGLDEFSSSLKVFRIELEQQYLKALSELEKKFENAEAIKNYEQISKICIQYKEKLNSFFSIIDKNEKLFLQFIPPENSYFSFGFLKGMYKTILPTSVSRGDRAVLLTEKEELEGRRSFIFDLMKEYAKQLSSFESKISLELKNFQNIHTRGLDTDVEGSSFNYSIVSKEMQSWQDSRLKKEKQLIEDEKGMSLCKRRALGVCFLGLTLGASACNHELGLRGERGGAKSIWS